MYDISQIWELINNPPLALRELNILYHTRLGTREANPDGVNFLREDWDNLLIIDACRFDTFEELIGDHGIQGSLSSRQSLGTATLQFLRENLDGQDHSDIVYVTGQSMLYRESVLNGNILPHLYEIVDVWENKIEFGKGGVPPEAVSNGLKVAVEEYPDKKVIAHYIQPHTPFIGKFGQRYFGEGEHAIWDDKLTGKCDISDDTIWRAYRENLDVVLSELANAVKDLPGKTVITSDHGQCIGDRVHPIPYHEYGHPTGLYVEELTVVPWYVCEFETRRKTEKGRATSGYGDTSAERDEAVRSQLEGLGYLE